MRKALSIARVMRARGRTALSLATLVAASVAAGCAHGTVRDGVFHRDGGAYRVAVPPSPWKVTCAEGTELATTHPTLGATMGVSRHCDPRRTDDLAVLSRGAFVGIEEKAWRVREPRALPAGEAFYSELDGTFEGKRARIAAYTLLDGPCIVDLVYVAPRERFDAAAGDFEAMAHALRLR